MGTLLDIAGAIIVRGTIVAIMLTVTVTLNDVLYFKTASRNVQSELSSTVEILESDLRKAGYDVTDSTAFRVADTSSVRFLADIDASGSVDTISYFLSAPSALSSTSNPNDKLLYRTVSGLNGGNPSAVGGGIVQFRLRYYKITGEEITDFVNGLPLINSIEIQMQMEHGNFLSKYSPNRSGNDWYPSAYWRRKVYPINL